MALTHTDLAALAPGEAPATRLEGRLTYDATVPRELVHKESVHEVLLTDARQIDEDTYVCGGQLPRTHSFYSDGFYSDGVSIRYDVMLLMELKRQGGVMIAHRWQGIPDSYRFVFLGIDLSVGHPEALIVGPTPACVLMTIRIADRQYRNGALTAYTIDTVFNIDGLDVCTARGSVSFLPRPVYEKMRRKQREAQGVPPDPPLQCAARRFPVAPELLGRHNESNVVLSGLSRVEPSDHYEAIVAVDHRHPCLFDHRLDHVPGMLLLEAHRQISLAATADRLGVSPGRLIITRFAAAFERFAELDLELTCEARVAPEDGADVETTTRLVQSGGTVAAGEFAFAVTE